MSADDVPVSATSALMPPALPAPVAPARRRLKLVVQLVGGGIVGVAVGSAIGFARRRIDPALLDAITFPLPAVDAGFAVFFALATLWPQVILHEAGHALAGIARGMQPIAFGIGPWRWERGQDRWRLRRAGRVRGIAGFAMLLPRGERGLGRLDQAFYLFGGPLANLIVLACMLAVLPWVSEAPVTAALVLGTAATAALIGFVNLVPFQAQGWRSDGRNLIDLFAASREAEQARRVRQVLALTMAGVRPRDWPDEALPAWPEADIDEQGWTDVYAVSLRLSHALDRGDPVSARHCAQRLASGYARVPEAFRPHVAIGMASFAALVERDLGLLTAWRSLCEGGLLDLGALRAWLDVEREVLSGDVATARENLAVARGVMHRVPDEVTGLQLREYLDAIEQRLASGPPANLVKEA